MKNKAEVLNKEKEGYYEKPLFEKQDRMNFPSEIMEKINGGRFCLQCSSCHGCN